MNSFITTAIDYPNALPHIGTAFEKIGADAYARFRRLQGRDVFFSMGNDENTVKVVKTLKENADAWGNITFKAYVDEMAKKFQDVWNLLDISNDSFIQTSEERHKVGVQLFLNAVNDAGYIEKRPYKGLYCEGCEEFKTPQNLVEGKCPNHQVPLVEREEENYFFLQSKFRQQVLGLIGSKLLIEPPSRLNEMRKYVESELQDISISRKNEGWGIPIPWDDTQVTYVWFDALLNYLTVIGFGSDWKTFKKYWPAEIHFIGKDITRFHCALFPAMCIAYNEGCDKVGALTIQLPKRVFAHGFVNQDGIKASKTNKALAPLDLVSQFGKDAYRYYFLAKLNFDNDGEYSLKHFKEVYNADLANALGNLVSRTVSMTLQCFNGELPGGESPDPASFWLDEIALKDYEKSLEKCDFRTALEEIWEIVAYANQYIEQNKPWDLIKTDKDKCAFVLRSLAACLRVIGLLLTPFVPTAAAKIYSSFYWDEDFNEVTWKFLEQLATDNFVGLENGINVNSDCLDENGKYPPLFPRVVIASEEK